MTTMMALALADLRKDWVLSLCHVLVLAAVLTPLLVLLGLDRGMIGEMLDQLRQDPAMREIGPRVTGSNRFDEAWLQAARRRPDVVFAVGDARALAAGVEVTAAAAASPVVATLVPTQADDPLRADVQGRLIPWAAGADRVVVSASAARDLGAAPGTRLDILVPRRRDGRDEGTRLSVTVASVLPERLMAEGRRAILADASLVFAVQRYRDGYAVPTLGWDGAMPPAGPPHYERFRLYARTIGDVAGIDRWLLAQAIEPVSRLGDIAPVTALDHSLTRVLLIIAGFAAVGLGGAIAGTQWSGVRRRRRELALLALAGCGRGALLLMVLFQALVLSALGILAALLLFDLAAVSIDFAFVAVPGQSGSACRLGVRAGATAGTATLCVAMSAAAAASSQVAGIDPAQAVRDV